MQILAQTNIWKEYNYDRLIQSIIERNIPLQEVGLIPFTENFQEEITIEPTVVFGSNRFVNVCRIKGYPTFKSFDPIEDFYPRDAWINGNGQWIKWGELKIDSPKFLKPKTEKFFTGLVVEKQEDLEKVQLASSFLANEDDELIWVTNPVNIKREIRFFVIKGQIVTASQYRRNGQVEHKLSEWVYDTSAWAAVTDILSNRGMIDDAFVMDMGLTDEGKWLIVELNNFNSSGLYECNTDAIVSALQIL